MAIWKVAPAPGPFLDTNGLPNKHTCALYSTPTAIVMSYNTRLQ